MEIDDSFLDSPRGRDVSMLSGFPLTLRDVEFDGGEDWSGRMSRMLRPLKYACIACSMCELGRLRYEDYPTTDNRFDPHVFSNMNPSRWMVVGQNPGLNECKEHEPFVGDSGKFFDKVLNKFGLSRNKFYISNCVRCFTIGNKQPSGIHKSSCKPFLQMEINLLKPYLVIALGSAAFDILCPGVVFGDNLGTIVRSEDFNVKVFPLYHPSPLNMSEKSRKKIFIKDMRKLCALIRAHEARENREHPQIS